jgi:hypothetical protein
LRTERGEIVVAGLAGPGGLAKLATGTHPPVDQKYESMLNLATGKHR